MSESLLRSSRSSARARDVYADSCWCLIYKGRHHIASAKEMFTTTGNKSLAVHE